jgi:ribonuclease HI
VKRVYLTTDGACIGNPGPGGWACILRYMNRKKEIFGCEEKTTNNRMELRAVIEGLKMLREPCEVVMVTDSEYVKKGITEWLEQWKARGWRKKRKSQAGSKNVLNQDLWHELDQLGGHHRISWEWVKGHGTHAENNRCDELANAAARKQIYSAAHQAAEHS